jgi:hypothetical protein
MRTTWRQFQCAKGAFSRFLSEEDGQGLTEYILLLSFVVVVAGSMGRGLMAALDRGILSFGGQLERHLKTGRAPVSVWEN